MPVFKVKVSQEYVSIEEIEVWVSAEDESEIEEKWKSGELFEKINGDWHEVDGYYRQEELLDIEIDTKEQAPDFSLDLKCHSDNIRE